MSENAGPLSGQQTPVIGPGTNEESELIIKTYRKSTANRMALMGAAQVNQNIEGLINETNDANASLMALGQPGENMEQIVARIEGSPDDYRHDLATVNKARALQTSLDWESRSRERQAEGFADENFTREVEELKQAYSTAMETEINRVSRHWNIPRVNAKELVDQDIASRGQSAVLPIFHRIYSRFMAAHPQQEVVTE